MNKLLKDFKRNYILLSLVYVVLGVLLLGVPETSGKIICYIIAIVAALFGCSHLIAYGAQKFPYETYRFDLVLGVGGIAVGAYIFFKPEVLIGMIPTVLGAVIFIDGIVKVQNAIDLSRMRYQYWWLILLLALLMSGVGICMILYPFEAYIKILMFTGICCIVNGVVDLCSILTLTHIIKKVQKQINQVDEVIEPEFIERPFDVKVDEYEEKNEVKQEVNEAVQEVNETVSEEPTVEIIEETEGEA